jgi:hypothetical protein
MEGVNALKGSIVGLDTAPLIYLIEENPTYHLATAIKQKASFFLTNDRGLPSLPDLKILMLDELKTRP